MKKLLSLVLVIAMVMVCVACTAASAAGTKTGLGLVTSIDSSTPVGEKDGEKTNGRVQVDTTICAVTLDEAGVIVAISFDVAQTRVPFTPEGTYPEDLDLTKPVSSKVELKDEYGMKKASAANGTNGGAGYELYEQLTNLETYCIGKTVADVLATKTEQRDDHHLAVPAGDDLKTTVTIDIGSYLKALEKAAANAK